MMKDYKTTLSVKDIIQSQIRKMYNAVTFGQDTIYDDEVRRLAFELDMEDDRVDSLFLSYLDNYASNVDERLDQLVNYLHYTYLEEN